MGYASDKSDLDSNAKYVGQMLLQGRDGVNGDSQIIIEGIANDTGFSSGDPVSIWPTNSGYLFDGIINDSKQYVGIIQDTPGATGADVRVCIGGYTYGNMSTDETSTSWGALVEFSSNTLTIQTAATSPTTASIGWVITSGSITTAGEAMIFLDQPWKEVDTTT